MGGKRHIVPVWFFIGVLLSIYGLIIFATGIYASWHPPETVLGKYHPALWWGILLTVIGAVYTYGYWPGKE
jgi:hypothetical protein